MIAHIGDINVALLVDCKAPWRIELSRCGRTNGSPTRRALVARSAITDADPTTNYFMTSRITASIADDDESGINIPRVEPALRSALAARFLLEIQNLRNFENAGANGIGVGSALYAEQLSVFAGQCALPTFFDAFHTFVHYTLPPLMG